MDRTEKFDSRAKSGFEPGARDNLHKTEPHHQKRQERKVDEAVEQTFPASDPPAYSAPGRPEPQPKNLGGVKVKKPAQ